MIYVISVTRNMKSVTLWPNNVPDRHVPWNLWNRTEQNHHGWFRMNITRYFIVLHLMYCYSASYYFASLCFATSCYYFVYCIASCYFLSLTASWSHHPYIFSDFIFTVYSPWLVSFLMLFHHTILHIIQLAVCLVIFHDILCCFAKYSRIATIFCIYIYSTSPCISYQWLYWLSSKLLHVHHYYSFFTSSLQLHISYYSPSLYDILMLRCNCLFYFVILHHILCCFAKSSRITTIFHICIHSPSSCISYQWLFLTTIETASCILLLCFSLLCHFQLHIVYHLFLLLCTVMLRRTLSLYCSLVQLNYLFCFFVPVWLWSKLTLVHHFYCIYTGESTLLTCK